MGVGGSSKAPTLDSMSPSRMWMLMEADLVSESQWGTFQNLGRQSGGIFPKGVKSAADGRYAATYAVCGCFP